MKQQINAANAPAAIGPYCHAIEMEGFIFTSGQLGIDPATGKLCEGVEAQARQAFTNLKTCLTARMLPWTMCSRPPYSWLTWRTLAR